MAVLAALLLPLAVAGCADPGSPPTRHCPAWQESLSTEEVNHEFSPMRPPLSRTDRLGASLLVEDGRPLGRVMLDFGATDGRAGILVVGGNLTLRALREDTREPVLLFDPDSGPRTAGNPGLAQWTFAAGTHRLALWADVPPDPARGGGSSAGTGAAGNDTARATLGATPLLAEWTFTPDAEAAAPRAVATYVARFAHRIC